MSTANGTDTTIEADCAGASRRWISPDDGLLWLKQHHARLESDAEEFLLCAETETDQRLAAIFRNRAAMWTDRAGMLAEVACFVRPYSLEGVLVQIEMLHALIGGCGDKALIKRATDTALHSIYGAVAEDMGDEDAKTSHVLSDPTADSPYPIGRAWRERVRLEAQVEAVAAKMAAASATRAAEAA
jgi:hypothetical protein